MKGKVFVKVVICDDESCFVDRIKSEVSAFMKSKNIEARFRVYTGDISLDKIEPEHFDLAFLDIEMGDVCGTDIAAKLKKINPHIVIFIITSHEEYLDEAMDLDVFRFIKKPLDADRLIAGLERCTKMIESGNVDIYLKNDKEAKRIAIKDIAYVEISGNFTKVVTQNAEFLADAKMKFWRERLSMPMFYNVHTSYIINMNCITDYSRNSVTLNDKYKIPIGYRKQSAFKTYFINYYGGR